MFRITEDPSSGSLVKCLAKNYTNYSIVSVDMDKFCVKAAYSDNGSEYAAITQTLSMSTNTIESFLLFLSKRCTRLPDDGSSVIRNMFEHF